MNIGTAVFWKSSRSFSLGLGLVDPGDLFSSVYHNLRTTPVKIKETSRGNIPFLVAEQVKIPPVIFDFQFGAKYSK